MNKAKIIFFSLFIFVAGILSAQTFAYIRTLNLDVGWWATTAFADIELDGSIDMLVGDDFGWLARYEQDPAHSTTFILRTNTYIWGGGGSFSMLYRFR